MAIGANTKMNLSIFPYEVKSVLQRDFEAQETEKCFSGFRNSDLFGQGVYQAKGGIVPGI